MGSRLAVAASGGIADAGLERLPVWTFPVTAGRLHDSTAAAHHEVLAALYWAADQL